jgi:hypothetical protein
MAKKQVIARLAVFLMSRFDINPLPQDIRCSPFSLSRRPPAARPGEGICDNPHRRRAIADWNAEVEADMAKICFDFLSKKRAIAL